VIFRATEQWFIGMDAIPTDSKKSLRAEALAEIHNVKWIPGWGERPHLRNDRKTPGLVRLLASAFGVCPSSCSSARAAANNSRITPHFARSSNGSKKERRGRLVQTFSRRTFACWTKCSCGASKFRKENDILDVWFDSGSSNLAVFERAKNGPLTSI